MIQIKEIPLSQIRRPLPRQTDSQKVMALMKSIAQEGLREPIDVLEVDGQYYGFSGCHRFEAHQRLGKETIARESSTRSPCRLTKTLSLNS